MADAPLLRATGLTRRFGGLAAVNGVSLSLEVGEVHAVIGTNGAGKSTLINMLSGELPASAGRIEFSGADVTHWPQPRRARTGIGRSYQRTTIFPEFSVFENCRLAAQAMHPRSWALWESAARCAASTRAAHGPGRPRATPGRRPEPRGQAAAGDRDVPGYTAARAAAG
jgi:branched-chain amino acid transport system ATP-binding protein